MARVREPEPSASCARRPGGPTAEPGRGGRRDAAFPRVRGAEEPPTPARHGELRSPRQQAQFGRLIRVAAAGAVAAIRRTDLGLVRPWAAYIRDVYASGADGLSYSERVAAPLPAPPAA